MCGYSVTVTSDSSKVVLRVRVPLSAPIYYSSVVQMPRLVFRNVNSRTGTIPVKENDLGVALVSGFSTNVCKMVMSGKTDPYECLVETLMSDRYDPVEAALR